MPTDMTIFSILRNTHVPRYATLTTLTLLIGSALVEN